MRKIRSFLMLPLSIIISLLLSGGCDKDDGECNSRPPRKCYEFENEEYRISNEAQEVVFKIAPDSGDKPNPKIWDYVDVQYWTCSDPSEISALDGSRQIVPMDEDWPGTPLEYTQYLDSDGLLCLKVSIPANPLAEYRLFEISAIKNKDIDKHETFYYASGLIIQDPVDPVPLEVRDLMRIRINGEIYSSEYTYNAETGYEFANPGFSEMLAKVESDDRWRMVVLESDIVDYIDFTRPDIEDYLRQLSSAAFPMTRAASAGFANMGSNDIGYFAVYDNGDFKGSNICKGLTDLYSTFSIQNLKDYGMNDKISSIAVAYNYTDPNLCSVITVWDDAGWNNGDTSRSKHRLSIIASSSNRQVTYSSLKNVKCLNSSKNWNDRISSISCHFGYWGRSMLDY